MSDLPTRVHEQSVESMLQIRPEVSSPIERTKLRKILCVDDSETFLMMVSMKLFRDFEVVVAKNGVDGLMIARAENPDLIVLDFSMPGMDGFEFCRQMRRDEGLLRIPIILLSAFGDAETRGEGFKAGCSRYLTKPVNKAELLGMVEELI